jgi:hypothetical protein
MEGLGVTDPAIEAWRLVGKFVLFLALCWLMVLVAGVAGAVRGPRLDPLAFAMFLIPGCALLPGAYYAIKLHRSADPREVNRFWPAAVVYGVAGLVLLIGTGYALYAMGRS